MNSGIEGVWCSQTGSMGSNGSGPPRGSCTSSLGAFSYTGSYVARRLFDQGVRVKTLTRRPDQPNLFGDRLEAALLDFSDQDGLSRSMEGAGVLYNTYWIRFARGQMTFDRAAENTGTLFEAAKEAGVEKLVHFSVSNPSHSDRLPYFRAKAQVEETLTGLGVPYAVIRPTLVFGEGDLLLNNIAWGAPAVPGPPPSSVGATTWSSQSTSRILRPRQWRPVSRRETPS